MNQLQIGQRLLLTSEPRLGDPFAVYLGFDHALVKWVDQWQAVPVANLNFTALEEWPDCICFADYIGYKHPLGFVVPDRPGPWTPHRGGTYELYPSEREAANGLLSAYLARFVDVVVKQEGQIGRPRVLDPVVGHKTRKRHVLGPVTYECERCGAVMPPEPHHHVWVTRGPFTLNGDTYMECRICGAGPKDTPRPAA